MRKEIYAMIAYENSREEGQGSLSLADFGNFEMPPQFISTFFQMLGSILQSNTFDETDTKCYEDITGKRNTLIVGIQDGKYEDNVVEAAIDIPRNIFVGVILQALGYCLQPRLQEATSEVTTSPQPSPTSQPKRKQSHTSGKLKRAKELISSGKTLDDVLKEGISKRTYERANTELNKAD